MPKKQDHGAISIKQEKLWFYKSMSIVKENTGLSDEELLVSQVGFKASPSNCLCGHEWSAFDIIIEAINSKNHDWDFFKKSLVGEPGGFFYRKMNLTCTCGIKTENIEVIYKYMLSKTIGWGY